MLRSLIESKLVGLDEECQYLNLIRDILQYGSLEQSRNGKALTVFGAAMRFSLEDGRIPILTTKRVAWKTCLKELFWFISGNTNNETLQKQNVKIWDANASREFLDSVGLIDRCENDLGPVYGHQWRHFNASYTDCHADYSNKGIDQLKNVIELLKNPETRTSRRIIMNAWNPCQLGEMALPPCHILIQFNVIEGNKLSGALYQRSGDVGLGVPFNIASYSFLLHIIADCCNLVPYEFIYYLGNVHIYDDHIDSLKEQITRVPLGLPHVTINTKHDNIDDYCMDDITLVDYKHYNKIKMEMRK
jgi:thymidylate synthase